MDSFGEVPPSQELIVPQKSIDVYVPKDQEEEYFNKHGIEVKKLPNGATIVGLTKEENDIRQAEVDVSFPHGSYRELIPGITHILEHTVADRTVHYAKGNRSYFNALTNAEGVKIEISATTNQDVLDYGVWPLLTIAFDDIDRVQRYIDPKRLELEKKNIKSEIHEGDISANRQLAEFIRRCIYAEDNPMRTTNLGTERSLSFITADNLVTYARKVFSSEGVVACFYNQGQRGAGNLLMSRFEELLGRLKVSGEMPQFIDQSLIKRLNPDFAQGKTYIKSLPGSGIVSLNYIWAYPTEPLSVSHLALLRLMENADGRLSSYFRGGGSGYTSFAESSELSPPGGNMAICRFRLDIPIGRSRKEEIIFDAKERGKELVDDIFRKMREKELKFLADLEQKSQRAEPVSNEERLAYLYDALIAGRKIVDADKLKAQRGHITPDHFKEWRDKFLETKPAIMIVGDLR